MDMISNLPLGIIETILCLLPIQVAARTSILFKEWRYHWTKISKISFIGDTFQGSTRIAEMDMISNLPLGIIETILCLLPIQVAARTSILSKEWRYHWTKISKISFIADTFQVSTDRDELTVLKQRLKASSSIILNGIISVLVMHKGPIHEFTLSIDADVSTAWIESIIFLLSKKNTVKKLTLDMIGKFKMVVLLYLYSLHQLTDLHLVGCHLQHQPTFNGFRSLTTLSIQNSLFTKTTLMHLLSNSPLLKNVDITSTVYLIGDVGHPTIINLFECFSMIENLSISFWIIKRFAEEGVPQELPTTLVRLKYLFLQDISLVNNSLPVFVLLIRNSPNLEKLKIKFIEDQRDSITLENDLDIRLEHLNELVITNMIYEKTQLDFVKLILTKSPVLKKARIFLRVDVEKDKELEISRILLCSQRASHLVEITVSIESVKGS